MQNEEKVKILSADAKPYDVGGNKGVSTKVRFLLGSEIFSAKATQEQVDGLKPLVGKEVTVTLEFRSPKENLQLVLVSFEE